MAREEPVVLVHGFATSTDLTWRSNGWLDLIADAGRTGIGLDLPGHGSQIRHHDPTSYQSLIEDMTAKLPGGPIDAIGYSQGSTVLLTIASREPDRFRRLVLTGAGQSVFARSAGSEVLAQALAGELDESQISDEERVTLDQFLHLGKAYGNDPLALAAFLRRPYVPLEPEMLATVACPVLVILGENDFAGPGEPLVEALPDAHLMMVPRVDHFNAPKEFSVIEAALDFIDAQPF